MEETFEIAAPFQLAVARQIVRSFYAMQGGDMAHLAEGLTPNAGDLQLAYDVLNMPEMQQLKELARYGQYEYDNDGVPCRWETDDWAASSPALREWLLS